MMAHLQDSPNGDTVLVRFGKRVRALRNARGVSQEALAATCGLDRTYMSGIERGVRNVSLKNISAIASAFGIDLQNLFIDV